MTFVMTPSTSRKVPFRQIRAVYDEDSVRVYQAYSNEIAEAALKAGTLAVPMFKMDRMTWIKPSFLWMMYRSGWGKKDHGQARILALDISRSGFEWALRHSRLTHAASQSQNEDLQIPPVPTPVRVQWDPERSLMLGALQHRSIQIGLSKSAVRAYVGEWIQKISDVTEQAHLIHALTQRRALIEAAELLPNERPYPVDDELAVHLRMNDFSEDSGDE